MRQIKRFALSLYQKFIAPKNTDEDLYRREFILNVILLATIVLLLWSELYLIESRVEEGSTYHGVPIILFTLIVLFFIGLFFLSRKGLVKLASYTLIASYFFSICYAAFYWGPDLPTALLSYGLLITIASVLINSRFGFLTAGSIAFVVITLGYLNNRGIVVAQQYWITKTIYVSDTIEYSIILLIIAVISWLSNREIERSLRRARKSETALKAERDSLEMRVDRRTQELRQLQLQHVTELHHFAELGKLATGFFHDLMNPLTALTLAVEQFGLTKTTNKNTLAEQLDHALTASRRVGELITALRRYVTLTTEPELLSLNTELRRITNLLDFTARKYTIKLELQTTQEITLSANPYNVYNIIHNLIAFSIAETQTFSTNLDRVILILLHQRAKGTLLEIIYPGDRQPSLNENPGNSTNLALIIAKNMLVQLRGTLKIKSNQAERIVVLTASFPAES